MDQYITFTVKNIIKSSQVDTLKTNERISNVLKRRSFLRTSISVLSENFISGLCLRNLNLINWVRAGARIRCYRIYYRDASRSSYYTYICICISVLLSTDVSELMYALRCILLSLLRVFIAIFPYSSKEI